MRPPVAVRDAATIMVVRDAVDGAGAPTIEVLMLRRNANSVWVANAYLFPGGAVDPADRAEAIARHCSGRHDEEASRILGIEEGGRGFFVAAVRECFEEAGVLIARAGEAPLSFADGDVARRFVEHRRQLNAGETSLDAICSAEDLTLDLDAIAYFSHWITPEGSPRRYDTRFFVGVLPPGQQALHDDSEVVETIWVEPSAAAERHLKGDLDLMFPTLKNLEAIGRFRTTAELMAAAAAAEVPTILPRITADGDGVRIVLPGDKDYAEATGLPPGVPFPDRPRPREEPPDG